MKHVKPFKIFESVKEQDLPPNLLKILEKRVTGTWRINPQTGKIDVEGDLKLMEDRSYNLPGGRLIATNLKEVFSGFEIGKVTGDYQCARISTYSLEGGPDFVGGDCSIWSNPHLKGLNGSPSFVGGDFLFEARECVYNLIGSPEVVKGNFTYRYGGHSHCTTPSYVGLSPEIGGTFLVTDFQGYVDNFGNRHYNKGVKMDFRSFAENVKKSFKYWELFKDERFFYKYILPNFKKSPKTLLDVISVKELLTSYWDKYVDKKYENTKFFRYTIPETRRDFFYALKPFAEDEETKKIIDEYEAYIKIERYEKLKQFI